MKIYHREVKICSTAYVVADSLERAEELFKETFTDNEYFLTTDGDLVDGGYFDDLLERGCESATISPAITFYGAFDHDAEFEEVEQ